MMAKGERTQSEEAAAYLSSELFRLSLAAANRGWYRVSLAIMKARSNLKPEMHYADRRRA